jgi:hypothetical protein
VPAYLSRQERSGRRVVRRLSHYLEQGREL